MKEFAYIHEEGNVPESLKNVPFLSSFKEGHLNDILYSSYFIECDPGDIIIEEDADDERIFILLTGEVEIRKADEHIADISNEGEVFGEMALVSGERRLASVVSKARTLCLVIDQKFLNEIKPEDQNAEYYAALYGFISRVLVNRLQKQTERVAELEREVEELKDA